MYVHRMIPHSYLVNPLHSYQQIHIILQSMTYYDPELGFIFLIAILCALKTWHFLQEIGPILSFNWFLRLLLRILKEESLFLYIYSFE